MKKVIDILAKKGSNVISVSPEAKIISALQIMQEKNIGSVVVIQEGKYMGILTERDYARKVILLDKNSSDTSVAEIMTTDLPLIDRTTSLESCMVIMSEKNIRYLPVVEEGELMGIISINDLIRSTIQNHLEMIEHLKNYIHT
ncbi:MAG: CBS domain-containing protein [Cytophagales bacterium]|jgi:CBS domain-containing protein|nr:CBS domain-containing protein [Cytophagales bacterium]